MRTTPCLALLLSLMAGGCGPSEESTTVEDERGNKASVTKSAERNDVQIKIETDHGKTVLTQTEDGGMSIVGPDGQKIAIAGQEGEVTLPKGFPEDVPVYEGATPVNTAEIPDGTLVVLTTSDPLAAVAGFYKERLKAEGWEQQGAAEEPESVTLVNGKEGRELIVAVLREGELTTINLRVSKPSP